MASTLTAWPAPLTNEMQVWFLSEHLVSKPPVHAINEASRGKVLAHEQNSNAR
ncbi:MAG TPA: hypothetical protein VJN64_13250 [Terriglobales bacterium]|nr:hypothetical protein [Terriglobales bacterium]